MLSQILADQVNAGYEHLDHESIVGVNGIQPRDLQHFVELVENSAGNIEITTSRFGVIVLNAKEVKKAHQRILDRYHIPADRSASLRS